MDCLTFNLLIEKQFIFEHTDVLPLVTIINTICGKINKATIKIKISFCLLIIKLSDVRGNRLDSEMLSTSIHQ